MHVRPRVAVRRGLLRRVLPVPTEVVAVRRMAVLEARGRRLELLLRRRHRIHPWLVELNNGYSIELSVSIPAWVLNILPLCTHVLREGGRGLPAIESCILHRSLILGLRAAAGFW